MGWKNRERSNRKVVENKDEKIREKEGGEGGRELAR